MDATNTDDGIYQFAFNPRSGTSVLRCTDAIEQGRILDSLGVSGSTLLQANCAIWVEGPSDRIYLRHWLNQRSAERPRRLIEGSDYSFVFYGGRILSHFAFAEDGAEELVALVRICRFSAVVMDQDTDPSLPESRIRDTKARIRDEATKDSHHRLAVLSRGREIENDVDIDTFKAAVAKILKVDLSRLQDLSLTGSTRYHEEIVAHLKLSPGEAKTALGKLQDKVTLAERVIAESSISSAVPNYVDDLLDLIERSRSL